MKNLLLLAAAAAMTMMGQDAKVASVPTAPTAAPAERSLSESEVLKIRLSMAQVQLLQDKYKLQDYQKEVKPLLDEQESIVTTACLSVGIPADKVKTECAINTGVDGDGKPLMNPDGKPVQGKVWWNRPAEPKK